MLFVDIQLGIICKEVVVDGFELLPCHSIGKSEERHEESG
jgi:hypothetical protein